ncbi:hypothetical protein ACFVIM_34880 [Streptomyces sp. NPDC057638]|uniref:hypothetical protein n=1 Tax=Streptomyces sp. NPDC057638 TaxID=3346190 RepID=UPI00367BA2FC
MKSDHGGQDRQDDHDHHDGPSVIGPRTSADDEERTARSRRWRLPLIAGVALAAVVAGGGVLVATDPGAARTADGERTLPAPVATPTSAIAPGEPAPLSAVGPGTVYEVRAGALGRTTGPQRAAVHHADGSGVPVAEVTRLGRALGLTGAPERDGPYWRIWADRDGAGPVLQVHNAGAGEWIYHGGENRRTGAGCVQGTACPSGVGLGPGLARLAPSLTPGKLDEAWARRAAAPVLRAIGMADAQVTVEAARGPGRTVTARAVVGGLPVHGLGATVEVAENGRVSHGQGALDRFTRAGSPEIFTAQEAIDQSNSHALAASDDQVTDCAVPVPLSEGGTAKNSTQPQEDGASVSSGILPQKPEPLPEPGRPTPLTAPGLPDPCAQPTPAQRQRMTVTRAVLGLWHQYLNGRPTLTPAWLLTLQPHGKAAKPFESPLSAVEAPPAGSVPPAPPNAPPAAPSPPDFLGYTATGRTLTLAFEGGVCGGYTAEAEESATEVRVRRHEKPSDGVCVALAVTRTVKVTLEKPLGDRRVVADESGRTLRLAPKSPPLRIHKGDPPL